MEGLHTGAVGAVDLRSCGCGRLACEPGGASLAAELIEPAILPVLPDSSDTACFTSFMKVDDSAAAMLSQPPGRLHPIEVGGVTRLRAHCPQSCRFLGRLISGGSILKIGGADACSWAGRVGLVCNAFWAHRDPRVMFISGVRKILKKATERRPHEYVSGAS